MSIKTIKNKKRRRRKRGQSLFSKTERSKRLSILRKRERDRVSRRLSKLLDPDSDKNSKKIKRRKRGPKKFKKTTNTLRNLSSQIHKADVLRRELSRVKRSLGSASEAVAKGVDFFVGSSDFASATLLRR